MTYKIKEDSVMNERDSFTQMPPIPAALIKALEDIYPAQDFGYDESVCKLNYHYGQRSVVNFLKHTHQIQNENILTND